MNANIVPRPPDHRWKFVVGGVVKDGDKLWTPESQERECATDAEIDTPVSCWKAVIRL